MIYQPTYAFPMNNAIDGTINQTFKYVFRGDKLSSYQIQILENNTNTVLYTGTKTTVTTIYNGNTVNISVPSGSFSNAKNLIWRVTQWEATPSMFVAGGAVQSGSTTTSIVIRQHPNVKANMYITIGGVQRKIYSYDYDTGIAVVSVAFSSAPAENTQYLIHTDFITSPNYFFKSRTTPVVTIATITDPITTRAYTFSATYTQAENVNIKYHLWELWSGTELITSTDKVFNSNLSFTFDGFIADETYIVKLKIVNQDDVEVDIQSDEFGISYPPPDINVPPQVEFLDDKRGAQITWKSNALAAPTVTGTYSFVEDTPFIGTNSVYIETGDIIYDNISDLPYEIDGSNFTIFYETILDDYKSGSILTIDNGTDIYDIRIDGYNFNMVKNGVTTLITTVFPTITSGMISTSPVADVGYIWDDDVIWDDDDTWTESLEELSSFRFKITILPSEVQIERLS